MKRSINLSLRSVSVLILVCLSGFIRVNAQIDEVEKQRRRAAARTRTIVQTKIKVVKVPEVRYQRISGVTVTTVQPNAEVNLESINLQKKTKWARNTNSNGVLNLENVPPGKYLLTVSLKGFISEESEIEVKPAQLVTVPVNLEPITHDILITTNVPNGEVRYAPIQRQAGGDKDVGEYCTVRIKNRSASLLRMQEGDYNLEIRSDDVEYAPVSKEITISGAGAPAQNNELSINLVRKVSTEDYLANWLTNEWRLPAGWKIESKRMQASGAGVALLQNERFNHYKNFELKTNVRSLDNKSVGFVIRARDDKNYYLIEITGSAAGEPYFLTGYVVKNGRVAETLVRTNIQAYAKTLGDRKFFNLIISGKGNVFTVTLEDIETGRPYVIGIVEDQNNTFPIGAIGVGAKEASRFDVNLFNINYR